MATSMGRGRGARRLSCAKLEKPRPIRSISCPQEVTVSSHDWNVCPSYVNSPWGCSDDIVSAPVSHANQHLQGSRQYPGIHNGANGIQEYSAQRCHIGNGGNVDVAGDIASHTHELLTENRVADFGSDDWELEAKQTQGFAFCAKQMSKTSVFVNEARPKVVRHNSVDSSEGRPRKFRPMSLPYIKVRAEELKQYCVDEQRNIEDKLEHLSVGDDSHAFDDNRGDIHHDDVFMAVELHSDSTGRKASSDFSDSGFSMHSSESVTKATIAYGREELINLASSPTCHVMPEEWVWLSRVLPDVCCMKKAHFDPIEYLQREPLQYISYSRAPFKKHSSPSISSGGFGCPLSPPIRESQPETEYTYKS